MSSTQTSGKQFPIVTSTPVTICITIDVWLTCRYSSGNLERHPYHMTSQTPALRYRPMTPASQPQQVLPGEPLAMTSSRSPLVYNHLHHHHHHQAPTIGFQMTSFSSLYVEGGLQELVCGEGAASGGMRTAAAMYRRAGGHGAPSLHAARLHYTATTAGIKKEPRDLGYDVTGTSPRLTCSVVVRASDS